jgi:hypothetical protein
MGANKADIDSTVWIVDLDNQAVLVPTDVKHYATPFEDTGVSILGFYIGRGRPIGTTYLREPVFKCPFGVHIPSVLLPKLTQGPFG